jgi:F0F1-type ATP synthase membrane subunit b/b'
LKDTFAFRLFGLEVRLRNIKEYQRRCDEYDKMVEEECKEYEKRQKEYDEMVHEFEEDCEEAYTEGFELLNDYYAEREHRLLAKEAGLKVKQLPAKERHAIKVIL